MNRPMVLAHEFVDLIPNELEERKIYISVDYATVVHKCCCGCGREVVTPLSPTDWELIYDGVSISLYPSIGNWSFECKSHYWIEKSAVTFAGQWTRKRIAAGRAHDRRTKERQYAGVGIGSSNDRISTDDKSDRGFWSWLSQWWSKRG